MRRCHGRPLASEPAPRDVDDRRIDPPYFVEIDPQFRTRLRQVIGEKHIATPNEFFEHWTRLIERQRQSDAALAAIGRLHHGREGDSRRRGGATRHGDESPLRVPRHRVLDLDDVGAPVGQHRSRRRHERELRDLQHSHTGHRFTHLPTSVPTWPGSTRTASKSQGQHRLLGKQCHVFTLLGVTMCHGKRLNVDHIINILWSEPQIKS